MTETSLREQLGTSYAHYSDEQVRHHAQMLQEIQRSDDVRVHAEPIENNRFRVTVCAPDAPGLLAIIAGLFTARRVSIETGEIYTASIEVPSTPSTFRRWIPIGRRGAPKTRTTKRILDIFDVSLQSSPHRGFWPLFADELSTLLVVRRKKDHRAVRDAILDKIRATLSERPTPLTLTPVQVDVDTQSDKNRTIVDVRSADTFGFFFEFTSGLELLKLNVDYAQIRTENDRIHDTFWVTDLRGSKITEIKRLNEIRFGTALIQQFSQLLPHAPNPALAFQQFGEFTNELFSRDDWTTDLAALESDEVLKTLAEVLGGSKFLWQDFLRIQHENLFPVIANIPLLDQAFSKADLDAELKNRVASAESIPGKVQQMNAFKDREMFRVDLRHITSRIDFAQFGDELSDLAEVVLEQSAALSEQIMLGRYGRPTLTDGSSCRWTACVLGKLGGREMGFASDIELIFVYEGHGKTDGKHAAKGQVDNTQYFEEFVTDFLRTPKAARDGIFEIDLRLRPYGASGNLACTLDIFRRFFSWDGSADPYLRLALVKLRSVMGDSVLGQIVERARDAFVYAPKPVDWDDIRRLRGMQQEQLVPSGRFSAKHSPGALVDVEYFVQATQIQAGANCHAVRVPSTLLAIERLREHGFLEPEAAQRIDASYRFWRLMIDALRCVRGNSRDLTIPDESSPEFAYLARRLRAHSPTSLAAEIDQHTAFCRELLEDPVRTTQHAKR